MSPLFSQFSAGGLRRTVGVVSGDQTPPPPPGIQGLSAWRSTAQNGVPIGLYNWVTGTFDQVTPQQSPRGYVSLYLGQENIEGTSWPGNGSNTYYNRTMNNTVYQNMRAYLGNFNGGGYLVWNGMTGRNEGCCDPNWIAGGFGAISEGPDLRYSWNTNYTSPITSNNVSTSTYTQRYRTDGSVNGGPGFYASNPQMYLDPY
jgi:hypothetical protein|tara:strand:- start:44 stop:646 length:603 start_codon:yes stop_codon:yes gene_type:complete